MNNLNIEIFPALKSCDQGCPPCPLAKRDNEVTAIKIDEQVQITFSLLEEALKSSKLNYDLHFSSKFDLAPEFKYPELVNMARFTTRKDIGLNGNVENFSNSIKEMLDTKNINPKVIGYSIVPLSPVLSLNEVDIIRKLNEEISSWYFGSTDKEIQVTIRSNLLKLNVYEEKIAEVFTNDAVLLKKLMMEFTSKYRNIARIGDVIDGRMYYNLFEGTKKKRKISYHNRVIANKKVIDSPKFNIGQAWSLYPFKDHDVVDFAIAPKGVMLMHTSLAINNPVLWISHSDFLESLKHELLNTKRKFSPIKLLQNLMAENQIMYRMFMRKKKEENLSEKIDFMKSYESTRPDVRSAWKKLRRKKNSKFD